MATWRLVAIALLLTGCATAPGAFYRDPMGFIHSCARPDYASGYGVILPIAAGNAIAAGFKYAECKTQAEKAGYVRIPPPPAPAPAAPQVQPRAICLERANAANAANSSEQWVADYRRCMAGY